MERRWQSNYDAYQKCADSGLSQAETSRHLGVSREAVRGFVFRHPEVKFASGHKKNAHLIAAAPDMMDALNGAGDALEHALYLLPEDANQRLGMEGALRRIAEAIAKAEGKASDSTLEELQDAAIASEREETE